MSPISTRVRRRPVLILLDIQHNERSWAPHRARSDPTVPPENIGRKDRDRLEIAGIVVTCDQTWTSPWYPLVPAGRRPGNAVEVGAIRRGLAFSRYRPARRYSGLTGRLGRHWCVVACGMIELPSGGRPPVSNGGRSNYAGPGFEFDVQRPTTGRSPCLSDGGDVLDLRSIDSTVSGPTGRVNTGRAES